MTNGFPPSLVYAVLETEEILAPADAKYLSASMWANQRVVLFGQNGGSFKETVETLASETLGVSRALTRYSMMKVGCDSYVLLLRK